MATSISLGKRQLLHVDIRRVPMSQPILWLQHGWDDLLQLRFASLAHGALIATLGAVLLMLGSSHPYFIAAAVSGYLLVGPIMTTGLCELSRRRAAREPAGFDESLNPVTRDRDHLLQFGVLLAAIAVVWFIASEVMLRSVFHLPAPSVGMALWGGFTDAASRSEVLAYFAAGAILAGIVFTVSVVAVPLIIDRHATALDALWASIRATLANIPAMLVWAGLIVGLTALGFLTLLVGMVVVAPVLGHATWHAYRDLIR